MSLPAAPATPQLTAHPHGPQSVTWWGMIGLITIEIVVFSGFIAIYFYLRLFNPAWPPEEIGPPDLLLPTLNTLILIASSVAMFIADHGVKKDKQLQLKVGQIIALALAVTFLALKYVEYSGYDYSWSTHAYGSVVYTITGFHSAHIISVVLKGFVVLAMAFRGMFTPERHLAVQVNGLYWHFVVVIWLPLYATIYLSPHL